jgi:hypothetical protein
MIHEGLQRVGIAKKIAHKAEAVRGGAKKVNGRRADGSRGGSDVSVQV